MTGNASTVSTRATIRQKKVCEVRHTLEHHRQQSFWDCGLSCVFMVMPGCKKEELRHSISTVCAQEIKNQSVWSIDLCYVLNHCGIQHQYFTKTVGIDQNFTSEPYYRECISQDEVRVTERFRKAAENGISVKETSLSLEDVLVHLEDHGPAIALVDSSLLACSTCFSFLSAVDRVLKRLVRLYRGHYVVLCGSDRSKKILFYRDPSLEDKVCQTTFANFEKAWRAFGTDDDMILVYSSPILVSR